MSDLKLKNIFTIVKKECPEMSLPSEGKALPFGFTIVVNTFSTSFIHLTSMEKTMLMFEIIKIFEDSLDFCTRKITCEFTKEQSFLYATQECQGKESFPIVFEDDEDFVEPPSTMIYYNHTDDVIGVENFRYFPGGIFPYADNYAFSLYSRNNLEEQILEKVVNQFGLLSIHEIFIKRIPARNLNFTDKMKQIGNRIKGLWKHCFSPRVF